MSSKTITNYQNIKGFNCLLELGKWSEESITHLLKNAHEKYTDPSERLYSIIQNLNLNQCLLFFQKMCLGLD